MKFLKLFVFTAILIRSLTMLAPLKTIHVSSLMYAENGPRFQNLRFLYTDVVGKDGRICAEASNGLSFKSLLPKSSHVEIHHSNMTDGYKMVGYRDGIHDNSFKSFKAVKVDDDDYDDDKA